MNITFPIVELVDRYSIAQLKFKKTSANQEELEFYEPQFLKLDVKSIANEMTELATIHEKIWSLEAELKSGREQELSLEEIGRRSIAIRDWNNKRIALKNRMADILGCTVREIKQDHLSQ
jgi:hypothetical protein